MHQLNDEKKSEFRFIVPVLKAGLALVIIFFIARYLYANWQAVSSIGSDINYGYLSLSTLMLFIDIWMIALAWHLTLTRFTTRIDWRGNIKIYFSSQLVKYIPGSIWLVVGRFYLYEKRDISKKTVFSAMLTDAAASVSSGLIIFLVAIPFGLQKLDAKYYYFLLLIPVLLALLNPSVLTAVLNFWLRLFRREDFAIDTGYGAMLVLAGVHAMIWIWYGFTMFVFANAFIAIGAGNLAGIIGIAAFSSILGFISFLTPAGIGVREAIFSLFLSIFIPLPIAVTVAVAARLWVTLVELLAIGSARLLPPAEVIQ